MGESAMPTVRGNKTNPTRVLIAKKLSIGTKPAVESVPPQACPRYENRSPSPQSSPIN